jgi:hypothetical protein
VAEEGVCKRWALLMVRCAHTDINEARFRRFLDKALSAVLSASKAHHRKLLGPKFFLGQALCTLEGGPGARVQPKLLSEGVARARNLRKSARTLAFSALLSASKAQHRKLLRPKK